MKRVAYLVLFFIVGCLMPLAIWVAGGSALYQSRKQAKLLLKEALPNFACSIDADCPPGYVCVDGYCVPQEA